jgi:hypothetical protein
MKKLTNNQKKFLRARGHTLKSIVMVGQHGLSHLNYQFSYNFTSISYQRYYLE